MCPPLLVDLQVCICVHVADTDRLSTDIWKGQALLDNAPGLQSCMFETIYLKKRHSLQKSVHSKTNIFV